MLFLDCSSRCLELPAASKDEGREIQDVRNSCRSWISRRESGTESRGVAEGAKAVPRLKENRAGAAERGHDVSCSYKRKANLRDEWRLLVFGPGGSDAGHAGVGDELA